MDKSNHSSTSTLKAGADSNISLLTSSSLSSNETKLSEKSSVVFIAKPSDNDADPKSNSPRLLSDISLKTAQSMSFESEKDVNVKPSVLRAISKNAIRSKTSNTDTTVHEKIANETSDGYTAKKLQEPAKIIDNEQPKPNEQNKESYPVKPNTNVAVAHFFRMSFDRNDIDTKKEIDILERFPKSEETDSDATLVPQKSLAKSESVETRDYECAKTSSEIMKTEASEKNYKEKQILPENLNNSALAKKAHYGNKIETISDFVPKIFGAYNQVIVAEPNTYNIKELKEHYEQKTSKETKIMVGNSETQATPPTIPETWSTLIVDTIQKSIQRLETTLTEKVVTEIRRLSVQVEPKLLDMKLLQPSIKESNIIEPKLTESKVIIPNFVEGKVIERQEPKVLEKMVNKPFPKTSVEKTNMIENLCQCSILPNNVIDNLSLTKEEKKESELWSSTSYSNQTSLIISDKSDEAVKVDKNIVFGSYFNEIRSFFKENAILIASAVLFLVIMVLMYCVMLFFSRFM